MFLLSENYIKTLMSIYIYHHIGSGITFKFHQDWGFKDVQTTSVEEGVWELETIGDDTKDRDMRMEKVLQYLYIRMIWESNRWKWIVLFKL